jgi:hypothetical protein
VLPSPSSPEAPVSHPAFSAPEAPSNSGPIPNPTQPVAFDPAAGDPGSRPSACRAERPRAC